MPQAGSNTFPLKRPHHQVAGNAFELGEIVSESVLAADAQCTVYSRFASAVGIVARFATWSIDYHFSFGVRYERCSKSPKVHAFRAECLLVELARLLFCRSSRLISHDKKINAHFFCDGLRVSAAEHRRRIANEKCLRVWIKRIDKRVAVASRRTSSSWSLSHQGSGCIYAGAADRVMAFKAAL